MPLNIFHIWVEKLIEDGNEVIVVTSNVYKLSEYERVDRIPVYRIPCWNLLAGRYPVLKMNARFWKINRTLKKKKFDMVIVNTRFYPHSLYGMMFAKKINAKCITLDHGTSHLSVHNMVFPGHVMNGWHIFILKLKEYYIIRLI